MATVQSSSKSTLTWWWYPAQTTHDRCASNNACQQLIILHILIKEPRKSGLCVIHIRAPYYIRSRNIYITINVQMHYTCTIFRSLIDFTVVRVTMFVEGQRGGLGA